ncbi:MAG TPA: tRNA dimethylallyltransferase, partial [Acidimicrobiia bacterium]|nr:tRNA dimethylallyltransferase [Acidimicrobiia bacterium]
GPGIDQFEPTAFAVRMVGVWVPRRALDDRIAVRFTAMREAGLVDEVQQLLAGPQFSRTAAQAIGYRELVAALRDGTSLDDAFETAVRRTRSFARRQRMWFRRDPRITWLGAVDNPCAVLPSLLATWGP